MHSWATQIGTFCHSAKKNRYCEYFWCAARQRFKMFILVPTTAGRTATRSRLTRPSEAQVNASAGPTNFRNARALWGHSTRAPRRAPNPRSRLAGHTGKSSCSHAPPPACLWKFSPQSRCQGAAGSNLHTNKSGTKTGGLFLCPVCIHTSTHKHVHAYIHTYIHTCVNECMHTCMHAYIRMLSREVKKYFYVFSCVYMGPD